MFSVSHRSHRFQLNGNVHVLLTLVNMLTTNVDFLFLGIDNNSCEQQNRVYQSGAIIFVSVFVCVNK